MSETVISVKDLNYSQRDNYILKNINFKIKSGDYVGIIGPNGSGKTTLMKLVLGLINPSSGEIKIDEYILESKKISYVSQQVYSHYKNFPITVFEVVRMGLYSEKLKLKFYDKEDNLKVDLMLDRLNIKHLKNSQMTNLSGGERQRALLGRSLISEPEILILDEPTSALDPQFREEFYTLVSEINELGMTILMVSHDLAVLEKYINKILYLDHEVKYFGDIKDYYESEVVDLYHGEIK